MSVHATAASVARLVELLGTRDIAILRDLARVRLLSGSQIERLHFAELTPLSQKVVRRRVLNRLDALHTVTTLKRSVGGVRSGSSGLIYALDSGGKRALALLDGRPLSEVRRPWTPGALFVAHVLSVAELYVRLREAERNGQLEVVRFLAEPACWQATSTIGTIKPDAYVAVATRDYFYFWWIEVDRSTESLTTIHRKLSLYDLAAQSGVTGPDEELPRVLITVRDEKRRSAVESITQRIMPEPNKAEPFFTVCLEQDAIAALTEGAQE